MIKKIFTSLSFFILLSCFGQDKTMMSGMNKLTWKKVMPGVWKASFGKTYINPLDYATAPKKEALKKLGENAFPLSMDSTFYLKTRERAIVRIPLESSEKIYGLGLEFKGITRNNSVYDLKVDHYDGIKGHTHAPVPFYVSSKGYGVLINSAKRVKMYVGHGVRKDSKNKPPAIDRTTGGDLWDTQPPADAVEASIQGDGLEIYVFTGNSPLEVVQRYNLYCGGGVLPPKWGLGFWHRMHTQSSAKDVMAEIEDFKKYDIPLDVLGLEPGWQSFSYPCSFDWDSIRFPDPKGFMKKMEEEDIKVNLWENLYVAEASSIYEDLRPYTGSHMVWSGQVPDFTLPEAREILLKHHQENHLDIGISGYKIDEVDGYDNWLWPDHATFPSGNDAVEIRQTYSTLMQKTFGEHFKKMNKRTYGLVRASYIGASSHSFVVYSDHYEHKGYITALVNSSLAGILWAPEIRSASSSEEWVRRFQTTCFSPFTMLNAWFDGTKPWSFPDVTDIVRDNLLLRMQLMPYLYTTFYQYQTKGIPPFRAMVLENGYTESTETSGGELDGVKNPYAEKNLIESTDQYMMGESILVAPLLAEQKTRKVKLPKGNWYDFYTGKFVGNGEDIVITPSLEHIPLFIKDGAVIPMLANPRDKSQKPKLTVKHYGNKSGVFELYNDDGTSFNYEEGEYSIEVLSAEKTKKGKIQGKRKETNSSKFSYGEIEWISMTINK